MSKLTRGGSLGILIGVVVGVFTAVGVAGAANLITGADVKNNSLTGKDIRSLHAQDLSKKLRAKIKKHGQTGPTGPQGPQGATGPRGATGAPGADATYEGPHWGIIDRNSYGSPVADLRAGPYGPNGANSPPPFGEGSLGIEVDKTVTTSSNSAGAEKVEFGNEIDFQGNLVSDLNQIGFWVYATSENDTGPANVSMPNITLEINPHVAGKTYTSMVYDPPQPTATSDWEHYDAATTPAAGAVGWYFTNGAVATATGCSQASFCTFSQAKAALATNETDPATILTVAVGKGRDDPFIGAIDGLQINSSVFDFEPFGVITRAA